MKTNLREQSNRYQSFIRPKVHFVPEFSFKQQIFILEWYLKDHGTLTFTGHWKQLFQCNNISQIYCFLMHFWLNKCSLGEHKREPFQFTTHVELLLFAVFLSVLVRKYLTWVWCCSACSRSMWRGRWGCWPPIFPSDTLSSHMMHRSLSVSWNWKTRRKQRHCHLFSVI